MIRNLVECEGCIKRRQATLAWLQKLKGITMSTVDRRKQAALSKIIQESGVSENAVLKVIEALKNADAVMVSALLELGKNSQDAPPLAADEEVAAENSGDDAPDGSGK